MMVYYGKAGWYANSLAVNLLFLFGILAERWVLYIAWVLLVSF
jgi:hypothetical protein